MEIFEYLQCKLCNKSYKGVFIVNHKGETFCVDCNNPKVLIENLLIEEDSNKLEEELVFYLWEQDLKHIIPFSNNKKYTIMSENNIDLHKLYFMGNPLELMHEIHDNALKCLEYIDQGGHDISFAQEYIEKYLNLREHQLPPKDLNDMVNSVKIQNIKGAVL